MRPAFLAAIGVAISACASANTPRSQPTIAASSTETRTPRAANEVIGEQRHDKPPRFEEWKAALENDESVVKLGNVRALNSAALPFAVYLNAMHNRIHPIFADSFLGSLDALPQGHSLNDGRLFTRLEIVLAKDGTVRKLGVIRTSGATAFDIAAVDSVLRAAPFGTAPDALLSPDGNVYLHWEFHRDQTACSTQYVQPFLLSSAPP